MKTSTLTLQELKAAAAAAYDAYDDAAYAAAYDPYDDAAYAYAAADAANKVAKTVDDMIAMAALNTTKNKS